VGTSGREAVSRSAGAFLRRVRTGDWRRRRRARSERPSRPLAISLDWLAFAGMPGAPNQPAMTKCLPRHSFAKLDIIHWRMLDKNQAALRASTSCDERPRRSSTAPGIGSTAGRIRPPCFARLAPDDACGPLLNATSPSFGTSDAAMIFAWHANPGLEIARRLQAKRASTSTFRETPNLHPPIAAW